MQVRILFRALVLVPTLLVAQPATRQAVVLSPLSTARERADYYAREGILDSALAYYRLWTLANPRDTAALVALAQLYAQRGAASEAYAALRTAAEAGLSDLALLQADRVLAPLLSGEEGRRIAALVRSNAIERAQYPVRFARQERMGRYRVLFPPRYDSLQRYYLVLLLHGNGNEPVMMLRWAKALGLDNAIIVCPEAPYVKVAETIAQGRLRLSAAGEDIGAPDSLLPSIVELSARWYLSVLDDAERTLPIRLDALPIVVGFSQGGFYAQVLATRYPERFRAAVLLSPSYYSYGGIAERLHLLQRYGIAVLHVHGRNDSIVPIQTAWLLRQLYENARVDYTLLEFDGEHWIPDVLAPRIGQWITEHFR